MKKKDFLLWFIVILSILSILIILPSNLPLQFETTIPGINKKISIDRIFRGLDPARLFGGPSRDFKFQQGLDLAGGISITYKADMKDIPTSSQKDALESVKNVIERRINSFGVKEPLIQTATVNNESRVIVDIPGETDVSTAMQLIGTTAQLTFWEEDPKATSGANIATPSAGLPFGITTFMKNPKQTDLTGKDLEQAQVVFDPNTSKPLIQISFTSQGGKKFAEITKRNVKKPLAMVLDNQLIDVPPTVEDVITNGTAVIRGEFTTQQANQLAIQLNAGALPVPLTVLEQRTIGATLGFASLQKSLFAGVLGFLIIVIFMIVLYRKYGVIASLALFLYTLFALAVFKLIPVTLTLAGIAGFILSIGMAVDANILIFERMKEELRRGKPQQVAIELGFNRAWTSIRDSNISSLITSFILFWFGTGMVRGFALTLAIGVLISMFSAITVTRTFLRLMYKQ